MLKTIESITKYSHSQFEMDINDFLSYLKKLKQGEQPVKLKTSNFFYNKINQTYEDNFIELFNIYEISKKYGGIYFLTSNIDNICYLYEQIIKDFKLPEFLYNLISINIKSYKTNGKVNVFKEVSYIKYLFVRDDIFNKNQFSYFNTNIIIKEDRSILNIFDIDYKELINNNELLEGLISRNVTTIYNRTSYEINESLKRIKRDFQKELILYIYSNQYKFKEDNDTLNIIKNINLFLNQFGKDILKGYIKDYIYYLYRYKECHNIEILGEINHLLLSLESTILEDYYIIEDNIILYDYIKAFFIFRIKEGLIGKEMKKTYINKDLYKESLKTFFNYNIFF